MEFDRLYAHAANCMNGISDAKAAIRYFRKDAATNGNIFGIDPNQIYIGGYSAGAILAVNLAYINDTVGVPFSFNSNYKYFWGIRR